MTQDDGGERSDLGIQENPAKPEDAAHPRLVGQGAYTGARVIRKVSEGSVESVNRGPYQYKEGPAPCTLAHEFQGEIPYHRQRSVTRAISPDVRSLLRDVGGEGEQVRPIGLA